MPVRHARSETRGRPPLGRRCGIGRNGWTRSHNASGSSVAAMRRVRDIAGEDQASKVWLRALKLRFDRVDAHVLDAGDTFSRTWTRHARHVDMRLAPQPVLRDPAQPVMRLADHHS